MSSRSGSFAINNTDQTAKANKYYAEAYEVVTKLLENCDENFAGTPQ